tara:strand:+ start:228 stop:614 length:387 start_codon:yes stop_codon:yes gene_type:complete
MSTLKVNTIQNTSGGSSSTAEQIQQGRAKVWLNYNGSTNSIRDDLNVSSVTDNSTGNYTVNLDSGAVANTGYAVISGNVHTSGVVLGTVFLRDSGQVTKGTGSFQIEVFNSGNSHVDVNEVHVACFGD